MIQMKMKEMVAKMTPLLRLVLFGTARVSRQIAGTVEMEFFKIKKLVMMEQKMIAKVALMIAWESWTTGIVMTQMKIAQLQ